MQALELLDTAVLSLDLKARFPAAQLFRVTAPVALAEQWRDTERCEQDAAPQKANKRGGRLLAAQDDAAIVLDQALMPLLKLVESGPAKEKAAAVCFLGTIVEARPAVAVR